MKRRLETGLGLMFVLILVSCSPLKLHSPASPSVPPVAEAVFECPPPKTEQLETISTSKGLCILNAMYLKTYVQAPHKAEFMHVAGNPGDPAWMVANKIWGISINDDNRRITQVDVWPPDTQHDGFYMDHYGLTAAQLYKYWHLALGTDPSDHWIAFNLSNVCAQAELEIERLSTDLCPSTNPWVPMIQCPSKSLQWAGPADINFDGRVDSADLTEFNSNPYDFDLSGKIDLVDTSTLVREIERTEQCVYN